MTAKETPGTRLKGYIRTHWTRRMGGDTALAKKAGVRRQTLQEWYAGASVPRLTELEVVAKAMGVRRVDLVAAYDGVDAPETQQSAPPAGADGAWVRFMERWDSDEPPKWAERLTGDLLAEVQKLRSETEAQAARSVIQSPAFRAELHALLRAAAAPETSEKRRARRGPQ